MSNDPNREPGTGEDLNVAHSGVPEVGDGVSEDPEETQAEREAVIAEAHSRGLVEDGDTVTVAEARALLEAADAAERADAARATIAGTGSQEADPQRQNKGRKEPVGRDDDGRLYFESDYAPNGPTIPRFRAHNTDDHALIADTLDWYRDSFNSPELTADQAFALLMDARTQNLYRRDRQTRVRTPLATDNDNLREQIVEIFGDGTDINGLGEEKLRGLRAAERQGQSGPARSSERRRWNLDDLQAMVDSLAARVGEFTESDPSSRWREVLDAFIAEDVLFYDDKSDVRANIKNGDLRKKAWDTFHEAERGYKAALAREQEERRQQERQAARQGGAAAGSPDNENKPRALTLEELRGRADALEARITELSKNDQATWEQWREILDDFFSDNKGVLSYDDEAQGDDKGRAVSLARKSDARERALRLYRTAKEKFVEAEGRAGLNTTGGRPEADPDEVRNRLDELEARFNDLSQGRATWEQWQQIRNDFLAQDWFEHESGATGRAKGGRASNISDSELQDRAVRLYRRIRKAEQAMAGRPYDRDQAQEAEMAGQAYFADAADPSGLVEEELAHERAAGQGAPQQSSEPFQFAPEPMGVQGPQVAPEPIGVQVTQHTVETQSAEPEPQEQEPAEHPYVTRAVEEMRRGLQRAIDRERDPGVQAQMTRRMQNLLDIERDRVKGLLANERREAERRGRG